MPVVGMGGYFFRAKDPAALKAWYRDNLGVGGGCGTDENGQSNEWVWFQEAGRRCSSLSRRAATISRPRRRRW